MPSRAIVHPPERLCTRRSNAVTNRQARSGIASGWLFAAYQWIGCGTCQKSRSGHIKETRCSGGLALVRPVWTLTTRSREGSEIFDRGGEPGLDILRQQPDGPWNVCYIAYEEY